MDLSANCRPDEPLFYFEARALAHSPPSPYCIISPNQRTIRAPPTADGYTTKLVVLELYADGSYGPHEYSTDPQFWDPSRPHLPWIPRSPAALEHVHGLDVLWRPLHRDDYVRLRPGVEYFRITDLLLRQFQDALVPVETLVDSIARDHSPEVDDVRNACDLARHSVIHIRYTGGLELPALVDLVRGAKRQILKCLGHLLYRAYSRRAPVLDPGHEDFVRPPRDVVGLFTFDLEVARRHVRMHIPVWRIVKVASLSPSLKIAARVPVTPKFYSSGQRKLIGYVYDGEPYIAKLLVANPSQGLYLPAGNTGVFRFCGSVNTAGQILSSVEAPNTNSEKAAAPSVSSAGGPTRTYRGIRAAREGASPLQKAASARNDRHSALLDAFIVDAEGMISPAPQRTPLFHNYEARVKLMMEQHGAWGRRVPHGLRAMPAPWSEILQTSKLLVPETFTEVMLFGPHIWRINRPGRVQRHMMHGYMILRDAIHAAVDKAPIMMAADMWDRLLDHRGWKSLWGEINDKDEKDRARTKQIQSLFLRFVMKPSGELPQPWQEVEYNGRVYRPIEVEIEEQPAIAQSSEPAPNDSKRSRRAKNKARKLSEQGLGAQEIQRRAPKKHQTLNDVPDADWDFLLWEMIEINHRGELRALDRMCRDGAPIDEEDERMLTKMLGRGLVPAATRLADRSRELTANIDRLAGVTPEQRRLSTVLLLGAMSRWKIKGVPFFTHYPDLQTYLEAVDSTRLPGDEGLDSCARQEVVILHRWARMFVEKFGRAPTAPRLCPTLETR